jgi:hypothetical protein
MLEQGIVPPIFGPEPVSDPAESRRNGKKGERGRNQFAVLAVLAEIGSVVMLRTVDAHRLIGHL